MHKIKAHNTRYGVIYWCDFCKVTPSELKLLSVEEFNELEETCEEIQRNHLALETA